MCCDVCVRFAPASAIPASVRRAGAAGAGQPSWSGYGDSSLFLPEMARIWADEQKYEYWRRVEVAVCEAWAERGVIPADAIPAIQAATFDLKRIDEVFQETRHDVIAFVRSMAESSGGWAVHPLRADLVAMSGTPPRRCRLVEATDMLLADLDRLEKAVSEKAIEHRHTICIGRSHGIHAEPTTFGHKLAVWVAMIRRNRERVWRPAKRSPSGKISGAVGTHANVPADVEDIVLPAARDRGSRRRPRSSQRDRHAAYVVGAGGHGRDAGEDGDRDPRVAANRDYGGRPSRSRPASRVAPRCRTSATRSWPSASAAWRESSGGSGPALENVALWHERDISHSSAERIILPDADHCPGLHAADHVRHHGAPGCVPRAHDAQPRADARADLLRAGAAGAGAVRHGPQRRVPDRPGRREAGLGGESDLQDRPR